MNGNSADHVAVRSATLADAQRLSLVANATFLETFAGAIEGEALIAHCARTHTPDAFASQLSSGAKAWLAEVGGAPVGYALLTAPDLEAAREGDVELKKIYLLSRFHGSGIAERLLTAVIASARGSRRLVLGVKADNARAIRFYKKQRFHQIATRQFDVGGTLYDDVVLARDFEPETAR